MAKIDTTKIEGYSNMSVEEKLAALESYDAGEPDFAGHIKKEVFDKTASELALVKKQLRERMSAAEQKEKDEAERREKLQNDYDALLKRVSISDNKAKLLALGYEDSLAGETAEAIVNGEMDKVFANQKKYIESFEKRIRAEILKETPKPSKDTVLGAADYQKKIVEAQKNGDFSTAAYYTRLAAQETITN